MTTKEWLMRAWNIDKEIKSILSEQDEIFTKCTSITSSMRPIVVTQSGDQHKDAALIQLAEYGKSLQQEVDRLIKTKREILQAVSKVDSTTYRTLLYLRYLRFKSWEEIAVEMGYTYRHATRIHGEALVLIEIPETCP